MLGAVFLIEAIDLVKKPLIKVGEVE